MVQTMKEAALDMAVAAKLFESKQISSGKAAQLAGMDLGDGSRPVTDRPTAVQIDRANRQCCSAAEVRRRERIE